MLEQLRRNWCIFSHWSSGKVISIILLLFHNLIPKCQQNLVDLYGISIALTIGSSIAFAIRSVDRSLSSCLISVDCSVDGLDLSIQTEQEGARQAADAVLGFTASRINQPTG